LRGLQRPVNNTAKDTINDGMVPFSRMRTWPVTVWREMAPDDSDLLKSPRRMEPADITSDKTIVVLEDRAADTREVPASATAEQEEAGEERLVIQSVDRALAILEFVAESSRPQRLQDIAAAVGLKAPTCYHLLNSLVVRGFVVRNSQPRTYYLGPRVSELARNNNANFDISREAMPHLASLAQATGKTLCLAVFSGTTLTIIAQIEPKGGVSLAGYQDGIGNAAHATALGKAILAWLPEPQIARVVADHELTPFTAKTIDSLGDLVESLRQIRRHGFAVEDSEYRAHVSGVAIAIRNQAGAVMGAVGCLIPSHQADAHSLREAQLFVHAATKSISALYR
jgi:IclR family acetate operon transcriptional repressor